jgi:hypothetical protein
VTDIPAGAVTVADLYRELTGMRADVVRALTRIEAIDTVNRTADEIHRDHEARLRVLESFKWKLAGASVVIGAVAGSGAAWLGLALSSR